MEHLLQRDVFDRIADRVVDEAAPFLLDAQMLRHAAGERRLRPAVVAARLVEPADDLVGIPAERDRAGRVFAGDREIGRKDGAQVAALVQRLRQHDRYLRPAPQLGQALDQRLIVVGKEEMIGAVRQRDVEAEHRRLCDRHRLQEAAQVRVPQGERLAQHLESGLVDPDHHHVPVDRLRRALAQLPELGVEQSAVGALGEAAVLRGEPGAEHQGECREEARFFPCHRTSAGGLPIIGDASRCCAIFASLMMRSALVRSARVSSLAGSCSARSARCAASDG